MRNPDMSEYETAALAISQAQVGIMQARVTAQYVSAVISRHDRRRSDWSDLVRLAPHERGVRAARPATRPAGRSPRRDQPRVDAAERSVGRAAAAERVSHSGSIAFATRRRSHMTEYETAALAVSQARVWVSAGVGTAQCGLIA